METKKIMVTGALGYTGKYVTEKLLEQGHTVSTLTNSNHKPNPFGTSIMVYPFNFDNPKALVESLQGIDVLINTYWVRFNHTKFQHKVAVENTKILFDAAKEAQVKKIVHVSITNPSITSDLEYFNGKAKLEEYLKNTGIIYSIVRPAVLFGGEDILVNNIAWMIRHLPVFGVFGKGDYKLQPIHIDDFSDILIQEAFINENRTINAIGPETFTYKVLVKTLMKIMDVKKPIFNIHPTLGYYAGKIISKLKHDVTITREEIKGLMNNLLYVETQATGKTKLTEWAQNNRTTIGKSYANELKRRS